MPSRNSEVADLCAQLQQAQEERDRARRITKGLRCLVKFYERELDAACWVGADMMKGLEAERDAAIKQVKGLKLKLDLAMAGYKEDIVAGYRQRAEAAKRDAAEQRALARRTGARLRLASQDCHRKWGHRGDWHACEAITCCRDKKAMAPAEAQKRRLCCPECGEERPDDDRVATGMKCGLCAYGGERRPTQEEGD